MAVPTQVHAVCPSLWFYGASQVAQWLRISLPMHELQEMGVWSLDWEHPLEKEMETTLVFLPGNSMDRGTWWAMVHEVTKEQIWLSDWVHTWFYEDRQELLVKCHRKDYYNNSPPGIWLAHSFAVSSLYIVLSRDWLAQINAKLKRLVSWKTTIFLDIRVWSC